MKKSQKQNRIQRALLYALLPLLIAFLAVSAADHGILTAIALEQPVCCGMEEHLHTEDCYRDSLLVCGRKAHTHSSSCYLVLLEDNNVNWLLSEISRDGEKSLTGVIKRAVALGMNAQSGSASAGAEDTAPADADMPDLTTLDSGRIAALNTAIGENRITPAVVLNEHLTAPAVYAAAPRENAIHSPLAESPHAVAAVTNAASNGTGADENGPAAVSDSADAQAAPLTLTYDLNWTYGNVFHYTGYTPPTIMGESSSYSLPLAQGTTETIRSPSATEITLDFPLDSGSTARPQVVCFRGWRVSSSAGTVTLSPGEVYTYAQLAGYARRGTVTLTALWEPVQSTAINFFVKWNSANDGNTSREYYTPVLYACEYANNRTGVTAETIPDQDGDGDRDEYDADLAIRARAENGDLSGFPTDAYTFVILQNYTDSLSVDGGAVDPAQLNEHGYTILWYSLQYVSQDGNWHVDGKLVRKVGSIRVKKTFSGSEEAIQAVVHGGYYLTAENADHSVRRKLELTPYDAGTAPNGYVDCDAATHTYTWEIPDVAYGEQWTLAEHNETCILNGHRIAPYTEYTIADAVGSQSAHRVYTGPVTVTGQTYDRTIAADQMLTVSFRNIYPGTDSFILKKEDADTGSALAGAAFSLSQNGEALRFSVRDGACTIAEDGTVTELTGVDGFVEIKIEGLDFSAGDITVTETKAPEGYAPLAGVVVLTKADGIIQVRDENGSAHMNNGVLVIQNTSHTTDVTAVKQWSDPSDARDVTLRLLANGEPAAALFPGLTGLDDSVTLHAANNYTWTWTDLPAYADGQRILWSLQETRIGTERAREDGSFDNWTVDCSPAAATDTGVRLTVTNAKKDGNTLLLRKVDEESGAALSGAAFQLKLLSGGGDRDFAPRTGSTDANGLITFTGLPCGDYQLTETAVPTGYTDGVELRFTLNADQTLTITQDDHSRARADGLVLRVQNRSGQQLPDTGGPGTGRYLRSGLLLMLAAGCLMFDTARRRKGEPRSS